MLSFLLLGFLLSLSGRISASCPRPGPAYSPPALAKDDRGVPDLVDALDRAFAPGNLNAPAWLDLDASSFSVELTSAQGSLWSLHHTAHPRALSKKGTRAVNGDTAYRIASISKVFTTLTVLRLVQDGRLRLDDPVTKYIKELPDRDGYAYDEVHWRNISLRTLASQLSGIHRESTMETPTWDLIHQLEDPGAYGLPKIDTRNVSACGSFDHPRHCSRKEFLDDVASQQPLFNPNFKSTYSNINFCLLGIAAASATGASYESLVRATLDKLSMTKSSLAKPDDSRGAILKKPSAWGEDLGYYNATGGIYSTSADLSRMIRHVLRDDLLRDTWLLPRSFMSSTASFYGMPWETFRSAAFLPSRQPVTFVTKGGALQGYYSIVVIMPEQGLGLTVLVAGENRLVPWLREKVAAVAVPAVDALARRRLWEDYAGTYLSHGAADGSGAVEARLVLRTSGRTGLYVEQWSSAGKDVKPLFFALWQGEQIEGLVGWQIQLLPTGRFRGEGKREERWRALFVPFTDESKRGAWDDFCLEDWDAYVYGGRAFNELVFRRDGQGKVVGLELPAWRTRMRKVNESAAAALPPFDDAGKEDL